jgi:antitoxin component YwqK of YwqJK toxin-antitoxin module
MKIINIGIAIMLLILQGCSENKNREIEVKNDLNYFVEIPNRTIIKSRLIYNKRKSNWTLNNLTYSGYAISYYSNRTLKEKMGFVDGKLTGKRVTFYEDGHLQQLSHYYKGKLHGEKKLWSSHTDHILLSHLNYHFGKPHGEQKTWYPTGELHKKLSMNMGREHGIQQAFRKNGAMYANYEAKDGRNFGLRKTALCFGLEDESIQDEK